MAYQSFPATGSQQLYNTSHHFENVPSPSFQPSRNEMPSKQHNTKPSSDGAEPGLNEDQLLFSATEFTNRVAPPPYIPSAHFQAPYKPVAIPQVISASLIRGEGQPFARCWAPSLALYHINQNEFVEFIDNLNIAFGASPPLKVVGLVGGLVGMVPTPIFQLVGNGVQVAAGLGSVAISKSRTYMFMKAVNENFFAPRGLKVTIATGEAMVTTLNIPDGIARLTAFLDENSGSTIAERRIQPLKPYLADLNFDVPPPTEQRTVLAKLSAAQAKSQTVRAEKKDSKRQHERIKKAEEEKEKVEKKEAKNQKEYEKEMRKLEKKTRKAMKESEKDSRKGGRDAAKTSRKLEKELVKIQNEREDVGRKAIHHGKEEKIDKEGKQALKLYWVLIEKL